MWWEPDTRHGAEIKIYVPACKLVALFEVMKHRDMLTLFFAPGASSMAVHIALHEVGAAFIAKPLSFRRREHRSPEFLAINPEGKIPCLLIDQRPLTEVAAMLFYIARRFPEAGLLPEGAEAEAQAISWMSFAASTLHSARRNGLEHATAIYSIADHRMAGRDWALGDYSIADIHLFRLFWRFKSSLRPSRSELPNLSAHHDRMLLRPAVQHTISIEAAIGYELPA